MASISNEQAPMETPAPLRAYLGRMFSQVGIAVGQNYQMPITNVLPDKPQNGQIYYFGATIGATITSKGFWGYEEGAWVKL